MRRAIRLGLVLLVGLLVSGCGQVRSTASQANQPANSAMSLTDLHDVGVLQAHFTEDAGKPRLVLLVSPT